MSLPPQDPRDPDETVARDTWGEETVVPEETVLADETVVEEREAVPVRRAPLIWPWLLAFLLLILGGLGAYYYFSQADESTVPAVVGDRQERAEARVREAGFEPRAESEESTRPRGIVLEQSPDPGTEQEEGETVLLTVSSGPPRETVPDVVGATEESAVESLEEAGFETEVSKAFSERRVGVVVRQEPDAGENLREGATVALTVSRGREPVTVPDVVGTTSSEATATLREAGLEANVVPVPSEEPAGSVVAQNPGAGQEAKRGDTIRLNVARTPDETAPATTAPPPATTAPPRTTTAPPPATTTSPATTAPAPPGPAAVPDAVGSPLADAARVFAREGLRVSVQPVPSREPAGEVVAQARPAGTELRRGDTVQLNVSIGPDPASEARVPDVVGLQRDVARPRLAAAGFEVLALEDVESGGQAGVVLAQTPSGDARVSRGSLVILYVGG